VSKDMSVFSDEIQELKSMGDLKLTQFGATLLAPFDRGVIRKSRLKLRRVRDKVEDIERPFNYFLATALEVSKESGLSPEWNKTQELAAQLGVENSVMVTEDGEFLAKSPSVVKRCIDKKANRPKPSKFSTTYVRQGPSFDGETYTKQGKSYLRPIQSQDWENTDSMERLKKEPEYWKNEKKKFLGLVHEGLIPKKGIEFLIYVGLLTESDVTPHLEPLKNS
jgi:hypothetical protein